MSNEIKSLLAALGMLFLFVGCSQEDKDQQATATSPPTAPPATIQPSQTLGATSTKTVPEVTLQSSPTLDLTEASVESWPSPYTSRPTVNAEQLTRMIDLLQSEDCKLPCYLGIMPGETSWEEAKSIMESLGAYIYYSTDESRSLNRQLSLDIGEEKPAWVTPDSTMSERDLKIVQDLYFTDEDGIIQGVVVSVSTRRFVTQFHEYWSRYSLRELLVRHGVPDEMVIGKPWYGTGTPLTLIYEHVGIVATVNMIIAGDQICPGKEKALEKLDLTLTNTSSGLSLFRPGVVPPTNRNVFVPIEERLSLDERAFYDRLISNPQACFDVEPWNL